jgi:hypothetical protein
MAAPENLTIRRIEQQTLPDDRRVPPSESVEYFKTDRRREERTGHFGYRLSPRGRDMYRRAPRTALITRCDLRRQFLVNLDDRQFTAGPLPALPNLEGMRAPAAAIGDVPKRRTPTVLVETETVAIAERREFFGYTARHVVTTRRIIPLEGAKRGPSIIMTDGWYIDLETYLLCDSWDRASRSGHAFLTVHRQGEEGDFPTFKDVGEPERGYPVLTRSTSSDTLTVNGNLKAFTSLREMEITHLSTEPINPMMFEIPPEFMLVERIRQDPLPPLLIRLKNLYDRVRRHARSRSRR